MLEVFQSFSLACFLQYLVMSHLKPHGAYRIEVPTNEGPITIKQMLLLLTYQLGALNVDPIRANRGNVILSVGDQLRLLQRRQ